MSTNQGSFPTQRVDGNSAPYAGVSPPWPPPAPADVGDALDDLASAVLAPQSANRVYAGPTAGMAATPSFRALVAADIPNLDAGKIATGALDKARGGLGLDASTLVFPVVLFHSGVMYAFDGDEQYPQHIAYAPVNNMGSDTAFALRYAWPSAQRYVGVVEVQISAAVGVGEDFEVQMFGCVYGGSGLISAAALSTLDGAAAQKFTFAAGATATQRKSTFFAAQIGAAPITHISPRVKSTGGGSYYGGEISIFIYAAP